MTRYRSIRVRIDSFLYTTIYVIIEVPIAPFSFDSLVLLRRTVIIYYRHYFAPEKLVGNRNNIIYYV